jgi:hypothetical protein
MTVKLTLTDDDGVLLDEVDVAEDEWDYAQIDGGAATLLLSSLHKGRLADACICPGSTLPYCPVHGDPNYDQGPAE